jgi:MinD superfamily P-loop ATPase
MLEELAVISGKGGTGKTSLTASFAVMAESAVVADCDVDAADLHLVLKPRDVSRHRFFSGREAVIMQSACDQCGTCFDNCRFDAVQMETSPEGEVSYAVDSVACEGCGVCVRFCPMQAIDFPEQLCGEWMIARTRCGPMVHARLGVAAENSGKLVTTVRREARRVAEKEKRSLVIVDGPPGIGCPVIASVTGTTKVLVVTEPTVSGEHDLARVLQLTGHFGIATKVCVNKWDLNPEMTERIEAAAQAAGAEPVGRVRYDPATTRAQIEELSVVETRAAAAEDVREVWQRLNLR